MLAMSSSLVSARQELTLQGWSVSGLPVNLGISCSATNNWKNSFRAERTDGRVAIFLPLQPPRKALSARYLSERERERVQIADGARIGESTTSIAVSLNRSVSRIEGVGAQHRRGGCLSSRWRGPDGVSAPAPRPVMPVPRNTTCTTPSVAPIGPECDLPADRGRPAFWACVSARWSPPHAGGALGRLQLSAASMSSLSALPSSDDAKRSLRSALSNASAASARSGP